MVEVNILLSTLGHFKEDDLPRFLNDDGFITSLECPSDPFYAIKGAIRILDRKVELVRPVIACSLQFMEQRFVEVSN